MEISWNLNLLLKVSLAYPNFQISSNFSFWTHELETDWLVWKTFLDFHEGFSLCCCRFQDRCYIPSSLFHLDISWLRFHHHRISYEVVSSFFPPMKVHGYIVLEAVIGSVVVFTFPAHPSCSYECMLHLLLLWQTSIFLLTSYLGCRLGIVFRVLLLGLSTENISIVEGDSCFELLLLA